MQFNYSNFEESFRQMLKEAESSADISKHAVKPAARTKVVCLTSTCCSDLVHGSQHKLTAVCSVQAYNRKQGSAGNDDLQADKGEDDEAD